jgi:REP element-mobilizing transposase RayT
MHTNRPHRLKTFDYRGCYRYSLTFCTHFRAQLFVDADVVQLVLSNFLRAAGEEEFSVLAYCFMPDHVHFLAQGNAESSDGKRLIKLGKQYSGYAYSKKYGQKLWQPWGFERVLRDEEASFTVARYIVENPVRAGIAKTAADYPFVGSQVYELKDLVASLPT